MWPNCPIGIGRTAVSTGVIVTVEGVPVQNALGKGATEFSVRLTNPVQGTPILDSHRGLPENNGVIARTQLLVGLLYRNCSCTPVPNAIVSLRHSHRSQWVRIQSPLKTAQSPVNPAI